MKRERRSRRSEKPNQAMNLLLESLREQSGLEAVALSTTDGLLVAGAGDTLDVEWMGALGASRQQATFDWNERTLHVQPLRIDAVRLFLTTAGRAVDGRTVSQGLERILAA